MTRIRQIRGYFVCQLSEFSPLIYIFYGLCLLNQYYQYNSNLQYPIEMWFWADKDEQTQSSVSFYHGFFQIYFSFVPPVAQMTEDEEVFHLRAPSRSIIPS